MREIFKIQNNLDKIKPEISIEMNNATVARGSDTKSKVRRYNTIARKFSKKTWHG